MILSDELNGLSRVSFTSRRGFNHSVPIDVVRRGRTKINFEPRSAMLRLDGVALPVIQL